MANLTEISDANFSEKVLKSSIPVLLDLTAVWCGPCKAVAPVLEQLAGEFDGKVAFYSMDVDKNRETPNSYHVRAIPTLLIFKDGQVLGQLTGAHPKDKIVELVQKAAGPGNKF